MVNLSSGNYTVTPFLRKFFEKKFCCIDHQHGRFVMLLQTKNKIEFLFY